MKYADGNYMAKEIVLFYFGSHVVFVVCLEFVQLQFCGAEVGPWSKFGWLNCYFLKWRCNLLRRSSTHDGVKTGIYSFVSFHLGGWGVGGLSCSSHISWKLLNMILILIFAIRVSEVFVGCSLLPGSVHVTRVKICANWGSRLFIHLQTRTINFMWKYNAIAANNLLVLIYQEH